MLPLLFSRRNTQRQFYCPGPGCGYQTPTASRPVTFAEASATNPAPAAVRRRSPSPVPMRQDPADHVRKPALKHEIRHAARELEQSRVSVTMSSPDLLVHRHPVLVVCEHGIKFIMEAPMPECRNSSPKFKGRAQSLNSAKRLVQHQSASTSAERAKQIGEPLHVGVDFSAHGASLWG